MNVPYHTPRFEATSGEEAHILIRFERPIPTSSGIQHLNEHEYTPGIIAIFRADPLIVGTELPMKLFAVTKSALVRAIFDVATMFTRKGSSPAAQKSAAIVGTHVRNASKIKCNRETQQSWQVPQFTICEVFLFQSYRPL
jgi:hypothetical protein